MQRHTLKERRWRDRASARSLLLTILGEFVLPGDEAVPTRVFIEALGALGRKAGATRQALTRSADAGWLDSQREGRETLWSLTGETRSTLRFGARRIYGFGSAQRTWNGEWLLLRVPVPEGRRDLRSKLQKRLAWAGFGAVGSELWIGPHAAREAEAAEVLASLELIGNAASFRARPGEVGTIRPLVAEAWDLEAIAHRYRTFLLGLRRLRPAGPRASFVAVTRLVHRWRSFPFVDPQLPAEFLPDDWIGYRAGQRFRELHDRWSPSAQAWWQATVAESSTVLAEAAR